jgi:dihydrofolate synthase/folylpolyglutamate synthase
VAGHRIDTTRTLPVRAEIAPFDGIVTQQLQTRLESLWGLERRHSKPDLDGTRELLAGLGSPETRFAAVHVAGTNGKGSVCAIVERVLRAAGVRTGLYTSPHLVDFRERIRVNGRWADEATLGACLDAIEALPNAAARTFFEVATALAFDHFRRAGVEWAVVEVGLGGRLDSTNVLTPAVSAITSIALDHSEVLGGSHAAIAAEKAGILKPGVPAVTGVEHDLAASTIARHALEVGAPLVIARDHADVRVVQQGAWGTRLAVECEPWGRFQLQLRLIGLHQRDNARTALAVLSLLAKTRLAIPLAALREGFANARWPGRLEACPKEHRVWWDGAHNVEGTRRLCAAWTEALRFPPPVAIVFAAGQDKDARAMLARLRSLAPDAELFVVRTLNERARTVEDLARIARSLGAAATPAASVEDALRTALAKHARGRVLLCGSLFAVGEAMAALGGAPGEQV